MTCKCEKKKNEEKERRALKWWSSPKPQKHKWYTCKIVYKERVKRQSDGEKDELLRWAGVWGAKDTISSGKRKRGVYRVLAAEHHSIKQQHQPPPHVEKSINEIC